ncbi:peptidoglycan editing factor PgeF [Novosphingobium aquimarinum]|uniref:peptidoglycan editing factor PgeF n=1 Tax=Novosphingobium aquimarinum TaxID=2682494 RepID=UPI0012ECB5E3|nr:peptidoglycan editing factor PgeF [Novosphingobium aquimarinum]
MTSESVDVARAAVLEGIAHGFLGRKGGVSTGDVAGLNVGHGSGDDPALIAENRRLAVAAVQPDARLVTVYQVHSPDCVVVTEPWDDDARPQADALVTDRPGLLLGILTADCAPVLLADCEAGVIGAAHAGWKGAVAGVTDRTIEAMISLGAKAARIVGAVGPCIAQPSYEVDTAFHDRLVALDAANMDLLEPGKSGHYQFDLEGYVSRRLEAHGLAKVERLGLDTYAHEDCFFSYRRATHRDEPSYGRQISLIALR